MKNNVLLYFLSVGMISGWAVNDCNAMNMQNLPPMMPLQPVQPTKHQAIQPIQVQNMAQRSGQTQNITPMQPMQSSQQTQVGKGKKKRGGQQNQMQQGIPQAKPKMPTMPSVQQAKPTMPSMPQVKQPEVTKPLTAEDRFKQRIREMMKSGSTELVIDEDYNGLRYEYCENNLNLPIIADDTEVANYIREKVKTLVVNSGTINIALEKTKTREEARLLQQEEENRQRFVKQYLNGGQHTSYDQLFQKELERRQSSLNTKYNKYPLWFEALEHVILCNGSKVNACKTNIQNQYDFTVKQKSPDLMLKLPGMRKLYWWPDFGKYNKKDRSLELTDASHVKLLVDKLPTTDMSYMFSKITFPKNVEIDSRVFNLCNTIAIDCQSTKFSWNGNYNDSTKGQKNIIMNGAQFITPDIKQRITEGVLSGNMDFYKKVQSITAREAELKMDTRWSNYLRTHQNNYYDNYSYKYGYNYGYNSSNRPAYTPPSDDEVIRAIDPSFAQYRANYLTRKEKINITWPGVTVLEKPDFNADDALLLARKAKLNVSDEIYIKDGIKWIGGDSFSSSTKLPHNCFFNVTIPDSVIDIDSGAFSNGYIQDIIVRSERVKKLVQESGFQKNIIVDTNPQKRNRTEASKTDASKPETKHEISKPGNQQNELMESKRKISVLERRLMDTERKLSEAEKKLADAMKKQQTANARIAQLEGFLSGKFGFQPHHYNDNY